MASSPGHGSDTAVVIVNGRGKRFPQTYCEYLNREVAIEAVLINTEQRRWNAVQAVTAN